MIVDPKKIKSLSEFENISIEDLTQKIRAMEVAIRNHANNNFQNRNIRFISSVVNNKIINRSPYLRVGDNVQISQSVVNDGIYTVKEIIEKSLILEDELFDNSYNVITKVVYPEDVKDGVINLMKWDVKNRKKVGIKSETISRHTVTYFDMDTSNLLGYPASLLGFLTPYMKARF